MQRAYGLCLRVLGTLATVVCITMLTGCRDDTQGHKNDGDSTDDSASTETGGGTDTATGTESPTDTTADTETASNQPPVLPSLCTAKIVAGKLSGPGSGTFPNLSGVAGENMMAAFSYDPQEEDALPKIQLGYFDAENSAWLNVFPFDDAVTSSGARLGPNGSGRALVWVDARTAWDAGCTLDTPDECAGDVAFATLTGGQLDQSLPVRITTGGRIVDRPAIVKVTGGWVVTWVQKNDSGNASVWSARVATDGSVSTPVTFSDEYRSSRTPELTMAALNDTVLVMWWAYHQKAIFYSLLDSSGLPVGTPHTLIEGNVHAPRVVAGNGVFLTSYGAPLSADDTDALAIFTRLLDATGEPVTPPNRITWTDTPVIESNVAYTPELGSAIAWHASKANGSADCVDSACMTKVFAAVLDDSGALASEPILVSKGDNDLNPVNAVTLSATASTWFAAYEIRRNLRQQILYSTFTCAF